MKIIVGLGNPGKKYDSTRHNIGFQVLQKLAERLSADPLRAKFDSLVAECLITLASKPGPTKPGPTKAKTEHNPTTSSFNERLLLVWPQTFMNRSGLAVRQALQFYKLPPSEVMVVCDDLHLPVGKLRIRAGGSAGGQNGLNDILQQLGDQQTPRLRVGVGPLPEGWDQAGFVLGKFAKDEHDLVQETIGRAADAALCWAKADIATAMNEFN